MRGEPTVLAVLHRTTYHYARPVSFGEHRLMFRPRDSHDLRVLDTALSVSPPAQIRWIHDVFGNSVAIAAFADQADRLVFESSFRVQHYPLAPEAIMVEPFVRRCPFQYPHAERADLAHLAERHYPDPEQRIDRWARRLLDADGTADTLDLLTEMTRRIRADLTYLRRTEPGTRPPMETLIRGSGTCRDYALLMMEAARSLGFAARFVSGYLYDAALVNAQAGAPGAHLVGGGETHAWVQVYLPGAGWVEFDPTNGLVAGGNLIRVAVTRDPSQAIPLSGTYVGAAEDSRGMEVEVKVTAEAA